MGPLAPPIRRDRSRLVGRCAFAALVLVILFSGAAPASAHDYIESSDPPAKAELATVPTRISITLSDRPQDMFNTLTVTGPDRRRYEQGPTKTAAAVVSVAVAPLGPAGVYEIGYRIGSSDGHPVTGAIPFRLVKPGPGVNPESGPLPPAQQTASETTDSAFDRVAISIVIAFAVLVICLAAFVVARRRF